MAKKLDAFPEGLRVRSSQTYPWDEWLDGSPWELTKGDDYVIKSKSFVTAAQAAARRKGGRVQTAILPDDTGVVIQYRSKLTSVPQPMGSQPLSEAPPAPLVRLWAKHNGFPDIAERGNLPGHIVQAYLAAHQA